MQKDHEEGTLRVRFSVTRADGKKFEAVLGELQADPVAIDCDGVVVRFSVQQGYAWSVQEKELLRLSVHNPVEIAPGLTATVSPVYPPLPKRSSRRKCGACVMFDQVLGRSKYNEVFYVYENGVLRMRAEVIEQQSINYKVPGLNEENVGWCPAHECLCGVVSPACDDYDARDPDKDAAEDKALNEEAQRNIRFPGPNPMPMPVVAQPVETGPVETGPAEVISRKDPE